MDCSRLIYFTRFGLIFLCLNWLSSPEACSEVDRSIPGLKTTLDITVRSEAYDDPGKTNGSDGNAFVWVNGVNYVWTNISGYHVVVLDGFTGRHMTTREFETANGASGAAELASFLDNIVNDTIVILAVQNSVNSAADKDEILPAVQALGRLGVTSPETIKYRMSHVFIGYKGSRRNDIQTIDVQKAKGQGPSINETTINVTCAYLPEASTTCTQVNVAALENGGSCSDNSSQSSTCSNVLDDSQNTEWVTSGDDIGAWIKVGFYTVFTVDKLRLRQRDNSANQIKDLQLQFSDCSTETISLKQDKQDFEEFFFTPRRAEWVKFTIRSVHTSSKSLGFKEIQLFYGACDQETICDMLHVPSGETSASYRLLTRKFSFRVKASKNPKLILATDEVAESAPRYEIEIGIDENAATTLKRAGGGHNLTVLSKKSTPNVLRNSSFVAFWLDLESDRLVLGSGETVIFFWRDDAHLSAKYALFSSSSSDVTLQICARVDFCYRDADHYWPLDKISPAGIVAKATTSKTGQAHGGWSSGQGDEKNGTKPTSLVLDGTNSWVDLGDFKDTCVSDPSLCANGISASLKMNIQGAGTRFLLSSGGQRSRGIAVYYIDSTLFIEVRDGEKMWQVQTPHASGTWQTVGFSWNQVDGLMVVIDEGRVPLRDENGKTSKSALDSSTSLVIGRPNDQEANYGQGSVRDIAIWERSLLDVKLDALHKCNEPALYRSVDPVTGDYLGCFSDNPTSPVFSFNPGGYSSEALSPGVCRQECGALFYKVAALKHGQQCFCANSTSSAVQVDADMCYVPCTARGNMKCGGETHFGVYNAIPASPSGVVMSAPSSVNTFSSFNATLDATFPTSIFKDKEYSAFDASGMSVSSPSHVVEYIFQYPGTFVFVGRVDLKHRESGQLSNLVTSQNVTADTNITGAKLQCPDAVPTNVMAECALEVVQGSGMKAVVKFGGEPDVTVIPPDTEVLTAGPGVLDRSEPVHNTSEGTYLFPLREAKSGGTLKALQVDVLSEGFVTITIFSPKCTNDQERYCVSNKLCVRKSKGCPTVLHNCTEGVDTFNLYCGECLEQSKGPCLKNVAPPVMNYDFKPKYTYVGFVKKGRKFIALDHQENIYLGDAIAVSFPPVGPAVLTSSPTGYALKYSTSVNISEPLRGHRNDSSPDNPEVVKFQPSVGFQYAVHSKLSLSHNFTTVAAQTLHVTLSNRWGHVALQCSMDVQDVPTGLKLLIPTALSSNRTLNLTCALERGTNVTYLWDTGDGRSNISTKEPWLSHMYNSTGTKIVRVTARNKVGFMVVWCSVSVQEEISGLAFKENDILFVPLGSVAEIAFRLRWGSKVSFDVNLGDGNSSTNLTDVKADGALLVGIYSHNYTSYGLYTVTITAHNLVSNGTIARNVSVQVPVSEVKINHTLLATTNQTINITILPHVGTNVRYRLRTGDGRLINTTERMILLHFPLAGLYKIVLDAANDISMSVVKCGTVVVQDVISGPSFATHNLTIALSWEAQLKWSALQGTSLSVTVDFGDGFVYKPNFTVSVADVFVAISKHNYSSPGEYRVNVTLVNRVDSASALETVYVETPVGGLVQGIHRSEKNFAEVLKNGLCNGLYSKAGENISIAVNITNGTNVHLVYDFGDQRNYTQYYEHMFPGAVGTSHAYHKEGEYIITVTAWNLNGAVNTSCRLIVQHPVETVVITSNSPQAIPHGRVEFSVSTPEMPSKPLTYVYDFGNGANLSSNEAVAYHYYGLDNVYFIRVNVSNEISFKSGEAMVVVQDSVHGLDCRALHSDEKKITPNVFPVEYAVVFNCSIHNGTNVTYALDYGNGNNGTGNPSRHTFDTIGTYAVNVTAKNLVSSISKTISVTIEDSVKLSTFTNDGPTTRNNITNFVVYMEKTGTATKFEIDFADGQPRTLECDKVCDGNYLKFHHTYRKVGDYKVKITAKNRVSLMEMTVQASIVLAPCKYPEVSFVKVGQNESTRTEFKRSEPFYLETKNKIDCEASQNRTFEWEFYKKGTHPLLEMGRFGSSPSLYRLHVPARSLEYGNYTVYMNITMTGVLGVSTKKAAYIKIIPSPLIAEISGGSERAIGFNKTLQLDASNSRDPDMDGSDRDDYRVDEDPEIRLYWFCKRNDDTNYTLPENVDPYGALPQVPTRNTQEISGNSSNCTAPDSGGCFGYGSGRLNFTSSNHKIDTGKLQENRTYTIRLIVTKRNRTSVFDQKVTILLGDPPTIEISCKSNCGEKINPSSKLSLEGSCDPAKNCKFRWEVRKPNDEHEYIIDEQLTANFAATPIDSKFLVINPEGLEGKVTYKFKLFGKRLGGAEGYSVFEKEVNSPPTGGSFKVRPKIGEALKKVFNITQLGWKDDDTPLTYEIFYSLSSNPYRYKLLLSDREPRFTMVSLPIGNKANNYSVYVRMKVSDELKAFTYGYITVQVRPQKVKVSVEKLSEESVSDVSDLMKNGNVQGATALIQNVAGVLNSQVETQKDDESEPEVGTTKPPKSKKQQEAEKKQQEEEKKERTKLREKFLEKMADVKVSKETDLSEIEQLASTITEVSQVADEVSPKAQQQAAAALGSMGDSIVQKAADGSANSEEIAQAATNVLSGLSNVMDAATVSIEKESKTKTESTQKDKSSDSSAPAEEKTKEQTAAAKEESKNVTMAAIKMINNIVDALMASKLPSEEATVFSTKSMDLSFAKKMPAEILNTTMSASGASFKLPENIDIFKDRDIVEFQVMKRSKNVLVWDNSAIRVGNSTIVSLKLTDKIGEPYPVKNLANPIKLVVPQREKIEAEKTETTLKASTLVYFTLNVSRDDTSFIFQIDNNISMVDIEIFVKKGARPTLKDHDGNSTLRALDNGTMYKYLLRTNELGLNGSAAGTYYIGMRYKVPVNQTRPANQTIPTDGLPISASFFGSSCLYWDEVRNTWSSKGCKVSVETTPEVTVCLCDHLTSFGSSFFVPPNKIDFDNITVENLLKSPLVLIVVSTLFALYLLLLIPARRADRRDLSKTGVSPLPENDTRDTYCYEIHVHTGFMRGAGTSAEVSVVLTGALDDSPPRVLKDDARKNFRTGSVCPFLMTVPQSLGNLKHIRVWHNNAGAYPSWNLLRVMVQDIQTDQKWWFVCDDWLAVDEGDGKVEKVLYPASNKELTKFNVLFTSEVRKNLTDGHIWFSVVTRPARSTFTRVQRLTCCLSILMCTMIANAMWYETGGDETPKNSIRIGGMNFSIRQVSIGIMSSLVVFPANLIIVTLFRKSKPKPKAVSVYTESAVEVSEVVIDTGDEKPVKKAEPKGLPHWFIYVAYVIAFGSSVTSGVFVILYGIEFGPEKSAQWITSLSISFVQDVLLSQPIKVFIMATLFALLIKDPNKAEDTAYGDKDALGNDEEWLKGSKDLDEEDKQMIKKIVNDKPPDEAKLEIARQLRMKERQMKAIIREISWYIVFLLVLLTISYGNRDLMTSKVTLNIRDLFVEASNNDAPKYDKIHSQKDWWLWLNHTVVQNLYPDTWYNGQDQYPKGFLADTPTDWLLGVARLRQLRIQKDSCPFLPVFHHIIKECNDFYSMSKEEKGEYTPGWKPVPFSNTTPSVSPVKTAWQYQTGEQLKTFPYWGYKATYDAGGYVQILTADRQESQEILRDLSRQNWVDRYTRGIFMEFSIYNPNANLFSVVNLLFEQLPTGSLFPYPSILTLRLFRYTGGEMYFVLGCEIVYLLFSVYFIYREIKSFIKLGRQHFKNPWSILEIFVTMLSLSAVVMYFLRLKFTNDAVKDLRLNDGSFVSYHYCAFLDEWFNCILGIIVFLSFLKLLRLLRFNRRMSMLQQTVKHAAKELSSFMIIYALAFFAFAQFACLVFGQSMEGFGTFLRSCASLMDTILGKFTLKEMTDANRVIGPIFFYSYTVSMVFILINMFLSIINDAFNEVRSDVDKQTNDYEIVDFMVHRLKENIGKTIGHAIKPIYKEPKSKLERDFDTIEENADNVMHFMRNVTFEDLRKTNWFSEDGCTDKKKALMRLLLQVDWDFYENELADAIPAFEQFMAKYSNEEIEKFFQDYRRKRFIEELEFEGKRPKSDDDDEESSSDGSDDSDNDDDDDDSKDSDDNSENDDDQTRTLADGEAAELEAIEDEVRRLFGGENPDEGENQLAVPSPGQELPTTEQELTQVLQDVEREQASRCATDAELDEILSDVARSCSRSPRCDSKPEEQQPKKKKKGAKLWKKKAKEATVFVAPLKEAWGELASSPGTGNSLEDKEAEVTMKKEKKRRKKKKAAEDDGDNGAESLDVEQSAEKTVNKDKEERTKKKKKKKDDAKIEKATKETTRGEFNEAFMDEQDDEGDDEREKAGSAKKKKKKLKEEAKVVDEQAEMLIEATPEGVKVKKKKKKKENKEEPRESTADATGDDVSTAASSVNGKKKVKRKKEKAPAVQEPAEEVLSEEQAQQKTKKKKKKVKETDEETGDPNCSNC